MTDKPFLQRLDALANRTGIPQLASGQPRRRPRLWLPIAALAFGTLGIAVVLFGDVALGQMPVIIGMTLSTWLPLMGPVKPWNWSATVDERDKEVRSAAYIATLPVILAAASILLLLLPWRVAMRLQSVDAFDTVWALSMGVYAAIYLGILWNSIPTLYASLRWPADEESDD